MVSMLVPLVLIYTDNDQEMEINGPTEAEQSRAAMPDDEAARE